MLRHSSKRSCPGYHGQAWPIRGGQSPNSSSPRPVPSSEGRVRSKIHAMAWKRELMYLRLTWKCEVGAQLGLKRLIWG